MVGSGFVLRASGFLRESFRIFWVLGALGFRLWVLGAG